LIRLRSLPRLLLCVAIAFSAAAGVPQVKSELTPQQFTDYALRFIRYARSSRSRSADIPVLLVYNAGDEPRIEEMTRQLLSRGPVITGVPVRVETFPATAGVPAETLREKVRAFHPITLLVVDVQPVVAAVVSAVSRVENILTISTRRDDLAKLSLAIVGEITDANRPAQIRTYRNNTALKEESVRLPGDVLALTREVTLDPFENYRQGIRAYDFDEWNEVRTRMAAALSTRSDEPGTLVPIYGTRHEAYMPSLYLGAALAWQGDCAGAIPHLSRYRSQMNLTEEEKRLIRTSNSRCSR
jgi:hypothetical protein